MEDLLKHGIVSRLSTQSFENILLEYNNIMDSIKPRLSNIEWTMVPFSPFTIQRGIIDDFIVLKHNSNRYDISLPETHQLSHQLLNIAKSTFPSIETYIEGEVNYKFGLLPVDGIDCGGRWHRDVSELMLSEPSYLTTFFYLNDENSSSTEFIDGSHLIINQSLMDIVNTDDQSRFVLQPKTNQLTVFDGRIVHRGIPGTTPYTSRKLLYMTTHKKSYVDPLYVK